LTLKTQINKLFTRHFDTFIIIIEARDDKNHELFINVR